MTGYRTFFWGISLQNLDKNPIDSAGMPVIRPSCTPPKAMQSSHGE